MIKIFCVVLCLISFYSLNTFAKWIEGDIVTLQGLDKITARIKTLEFPLKDLQSFGILKISVKKCLFTKPTETPESIAYLSIFDDKNKYLIDKKNNHIFKGWMFSSSPALNSMEHPVYDLILIKCKKSNTSLNNSLSE